MTSSETFSGLKKCSTCLELFRDAVQAVEILFDATAASTTTATPTPTATTAAATFVWIVSEIEASVFLPPGFRPSFKPASAAE